MFHRVPQDSPLCCAGQSALQERADSPLRDGLWELLVPEAELPHGTYIELRVTSPTVARPERRVPAFAVWVEQDACVKEQWCARVWDPPAPYVFQYDGLQQEGAQDTALPVFPRIYEAHVGMAQDSDTRTADSVGSYAAFTRDVLPRIRADGYTAVQLMGIPEHPLYKSFGYQVSSYFAPSSRFGSADDFRRLVDEAHRLGLRVILDIPHSHACPNTEQGLAHYDTTSYLFSEQDNQWGTVSFDYAKEMTRRFLLSNCRSWLEDFHVDGFRFDAVGNMIYVDHGFGDSFSNVERCFRMKNGTPRGDESGMLYLQLANALIHDLNPHALTIAEEFSGMPGMTSPPEEGGLGFDYRFAMGIPDFWGKFIVEGRPLGTMWYELTNHRPYERTISYVECHDQCINGKDAMIWRLIGADMYEHMSRFSDSWNTDRGIALHKLMRLVTFGAAGHGYLTFMGNEFGHPEWLDDEAYAHRQWHLRDTEHLKYGGLGAFDKDMLALVARYPEAFCEQPQFCFIHEEQKML
ncbi:MAG: alpha-amylase family glycosyl hydrolase, partial [Bilophila sp.]